MKLFVLLWFSRRVFAFLKHFPPLQYSDGSKGKD